MTQQGIKAIETVYNGYRFRSRLEARWAVFFDTLGVKYEYEKEGYNLGGGTLYLPDFWLETVHMWAEIKPCEFTQEEYNKCALLARGTQHAVLMLDGEPNHDRMYPFVAWGPSHIIIHENYPGAIVEETIPGDWYEVSVTLDDSYIYSEQRWWSFEGHRPFEYDASETTKAAYLAARQARFEHGETPTPPQMVATTDSGFDLEAMGEEQREAYEHNVDLARIGQLREYLTQPGLTEKDEREARYHLRLAEMREEMREFNKLLRQAAMVDDDATIKALLSQKQVLLAERRRIDLEMCPPSKHKPRKLGGI